MPAAIKSLSAYLGDGEASSWRAALRVFELSYGKPAETIEHDLATLDPFHVAEMTAAERGVLLSRVLEQHPQLAGLVPERLWWWRRGRRRRSRFLNTRGIGLPKSST